MKQPVPTVGVQSMDTEHEHCEACNLDSEADFSESIELIFAVHPEISRHDARRGLCLQGGGEGGFKPWSGQASGLRIYGGQRGAAYSR